LIATAFKIVFGFIGAVIGLYILQLLFWYLYNSYWDFRVAQMCRGDGGVVVYQTVTVSEEEATKLGVGRGEMTFPEEGSEEALEAAYVVRVDIQTLKQRRPRVIRHVTTILKAENGEQLGAHIHYARIGTGAMFTFAEGSSFSCLDMGETELDVGNQIFKVE
jgi:hypothetical protein